MSSRLSWRRRKKPPPVPAKGTCVSGKARFPTEERVRQALAAALLSASAKRREQRCYWCPDCSGWHLTSLSTFVVPGARPAGSDP